MDENSTLNQLTPPVLIPIVVKYIISALTQAFCIPARVIPLIGMTLGAILYSLVTKTGDVAHGVNHPDILNAIYGGVMGFAASGVHTMIKPSEPKEKDEKKTPNPNDGSLPDV